MRNAVKYFVDLVTHTFVVLWQLAILCNQYIIIRHLAIGHTFRK